MENFKVVVFSIIALALVGLLGFWAFTTLQSGTENKKEQEIKQLKEENESLKKEVKTLTNKLSLLESQVEKPSPTVTPKDPEPKPSPSVTVYKNQALIDEIQKLVNAKVFLKLKSQGASVGTVQKFLNVYNKTSNKVDNDFGASTVAGVKDFQKDMGLTADGEVGPGTFTKMIEWLKKQG